MRLTPRRRIVLVLLVAIVLGYNVLGLIDRLEGSGSFCGSSVPLMRSVCGTSLDVSTLRGLALLGAVVILLPILWVLAVWCLRPVRALVPAIERVGPQNLGYRIHASGGGETVTLSHALDAMMDRIAAGYEGQRRFAANASHELRTPLAVQRTLIEVSMAGALNGEQIELVTRQLLATNERNEQLIEGLLVLSESDQGLVSRSPQRLDEIAADVIASHQASAAAAGVVLVGGLSPRVVPGERVLLERLITNLVENAIKYNRPSGEVRVDVSATPALVVTNTGPDVPAEAVAGLFEPFRRLAADRMNHEGGAGLGLTIARSITQAHDGLIRAAPADHGGLRVEVELPA